jgi:hypothetical protein
MNLCYNGFKLKTKKIKSTTLVHILAHCGIVLIRCVHICSILKYLNTSISFTSSDNKVGVGRREPKRTGLQFLVS